MSGIIGLINYGNDSLFSSVAHKLKNDSHSVFVEGKCLMNIENLLADKHTAEKPVFEESKDIICAFEGKIFNREYLKKELGISDDDITNERLFLELYFSVIRLLSSRRQW